jgi:flagellar hook-associated protein 1 FlgK
LDQTSATPGLQKIAAKNSNTQGNASGDNAIRLSQALRTNTADLLPAGYTPTLGSTASLNSFFSGVIGTLGIQSESASRLVDNQKTLVAQIESWRQSTSGVNMDEEMTDMIRFQKGYNAAARMITTMDEMLDKLINSTGIVGR